MVKTLPSNAGDASSIPDLGAKIPHALQPKNQNMKQYCNKFNKDFKYIYVYIYMNTCMYIYSKGQVTLVCVCDLDPKSKAGRWGL